MASDKPREAEPPSIRYDSGVPPATHVGDVKPQIVVLSEDEKLIMKECDRDSFFKRALPLSLGSMIGAYMLVRSGRLAPHPKFGSMPKVLIFGGVSYFIGKLSYLPICQQKILEKLPNSNLAAAIRKSKGLPEPDTFASTWDGSPGSGSSSSRVKDDYSAPEGLDDRFRPTLDRDVKEPDTSSQEKGSISYEELRRRNRQEYGSQISKPPPKAPDSPPYRDIPPVPLKPWPDAKSGDIDRSLESPVPIPPQAPPTKKRTNIWGDPIDE